MIAVVSGCAVYKRTAGTKLGRVRRFARPLWGACRGRAWTPVLLMAAVAARDFTFFDEFFRGFGFDDP